MFFFSLPQRFLLKGQLWTYKMFILRYLAVRYIAPESKFHKHQRNTKVHCFHLHRTVKCQVKETKITYSRTHCIVSTLFSLLFCSVISSLLEHRMPSFPTGFSDPNHLLSTQGNLKKHHDTTPALPSFLSSRPLWPGRVESGHLGRTHVPRPLVTASCMMPPKLSPPLSTGSGRKWAISRQNEHERETSF